MIADRPVLTLEALERFDDGARAHGREVRFMCPLPACEGKRPDVRHRSLSVNLDSGAWTCQRCKASGKLQERWTPRERLSPRARARRVFGLSSSPTNPVQAPQPTSTPPPTSILKTPTWRRRWAQAVPIAGTPGADYLAGRGIPVELAAAAGVRYLAKWGHWDRDSDDGEWVLEGTSRRVVFPIVDQVGELIGIQGRAIDQDHYGEKMLTNGSAGVFLAIEGVFSAEQVAITEAPCDALSLAVLGVSALATQGTSWPAWLPKALAFKHVRLAHDNDELDHLGRRAGDEAAAKLAPELGRWGATVERWRPEGAKDWNGILQHGLDVMRLAIADDDSAAEVVADAQTPAPQSTGLRVLEPYAVVVQPSQCEVDELLAWSAAAPKPAAPFHLWPWARVADVDRFYVALEADLSRGPTSSRWLPAVEDLRRFASLFAGVVQSEAA